MKQTRRHTISVFFLCIFIFLFAAFTRLYGTNWDQGQHLNPDERFLTMVATAMQWPTSFAEYLDTSHSKLNPHNNGNDFFVYGTWPVILVKFVAERLNMGDYTYLTLVGRIMSGICDLLTVFVVFLIGKKLTSSVTGGIISMTVYTLMTLPIQLAHFYTTDPYLTMCITISIYILLYKPSWKTGMFLGLSTGSALAAKISGILIFPIIGLSSLIYFFPELYTAIKIAYKRNTDAEKKLWISIKQKFIQSFSFYLLFTVLFYLSFRVLMPYFFADSRIISFQPNQKVLANWNTLSGFNDPNTTFPPSLQWIPDMKIVFPFIQMIFIGIGFPLSLIVFFSYFYALRYIKKYVLLLIPFSFVLLIFLYQGIQFNLPLRYFYTLYPSLAGICAVPWVFILKKKSKAKYIFAGLCLISCIWPLSVMSIYTRNITRVTATDWIDTHVPAGSHISFELWDDPLPLSMPAYPSSLYPGVEMGIFDIDTETKWKSLVQKMNTIDYIVLSSNRGYGALTGLQHRYPVTSMYYQGLFNGSLGFEKVAEFTSRPTLPVPGVHLCVPFPFLKYGHINSYDPASCQGITFIDDYADETWTVYEHPKVTIFKKTEGYVEPVFLIDAAKKVTL